MKNGIDNMKDYIIKNNGVLVTLEEAIIDNDISVEEMLHFAETDEEMDEIYARTLFGYW